MNNSNLAFLFQSKPFSRFIMARVNATFAFQMLSVAVGWQAYALTKSAFFLGLVGLAQFFPMFLLTLIVGHVADHYNRRNVVRICQIIEGCAAIALAVGSWNGWIDRVSILVIVLIIGAARAFEVPTQKALVPGLVSTEAFPRALAVEASSTQTAVIIGPALGGFLYAASPIAVYAVAAVLFLSASAFLTLVKVTQVLPKREPVSLNSVFAGISFIWSRPAILGAISMDLFAVLLGGATALLPIYAREILQIGPWGLGLLRSAPAIGALTTSFFLAQHPIRRRVGRIMFGAVAVFGMATIVFAISKSFVLSLAALILLGASDVISVVIRNSLVQMHTPDAMRGRVSAVNSMFIGTSNQLGEFESGMTAAWLGVVPAVLIGGFGTLTVVLLWIRFFPDLFNTDTLEKRA